MAGGTDAALLDILTERGERMAAALRFLLLVAAGTLGMAAPFILLAAAAVVFAIAQHGGGATALIVVVALLGGAAYAAIRACKSASRKSRERREAKFTAALEAHMGRRPDSQWYPWKYDGKRREWRFCIWTSERRFYFAEAGVPIDPKNFYDAANVREWRIQREPSGDSLTFSVNILMDDPANPLLKLHCGRDEAGAYKIVESINQMFGGQAVAFRDGYAIAVPGALSAAAVGQ